MSSWTLPPPDLEGLMDDLDALAGCMAGCSWNTSGLTMSLSATPYDGPGSDVAFEYTSSARGDIVSVSWSYQNIDDEAPNTDTSECPTTADSTVCWVHVESDGYMSVDIDYTDERWTGAEVDLFLQIQPCPGPVPEVDSLRRQYGTPRTLPDCSLFLHEPSGTGGWPGWASIRSHGTGAFWSNYALYRDYLKTGLDNLHANYPIIISEANRIYSTPAKQDYVDAHQNPPVSHPNGRHIYGDAADIHSDSTSWDGIFAAAATYMSLNGHPPCREPRSATFPIHVHVDLRIASGAVRQYTDNGGLCPPGY
jgi:hypothetical protein